ncbi:tetratricopeptide repeat protein [Actinophytocola sp.]|uniref:tetratricopeptide repeat protein n=1 Tax=Actinophytocola sp. TaxID=1872138 RepID=UPI0039C8699E
MARWTSEVGNAVRARDLFVELLSIRERVLGAEHPDTVKTRRELEKLGAAKEAGPGGGGEG